MAFFCLLCLLYHMYFCLIMQMWRAESYSFCLYWPVSVTQCIAPIDSPGHNNDGDLWLVDVLSKLKLSIFIWKQH